MATSTLGSAVPEAFSGGKKGTEKARPFIPTPERVSQFLEMKTEEVVRQMKSVEGRKKLYEQLLTHQEYLKTVHSDFNPSHLREQLDLAGETLLTKEKYLKDIKSPEKRGLFGRVWDRIKSFPRKHPIATVVLLAALAVGGLAGTLYLTGNLEAVLAKVGLSHLFGEQGAKRAAEVTGTIIDAAKKVGNAYEGPTGPLKR